MRFRSQVGGKAFKGIDPLGGTLNLPLRLLAEGTDPMHAVTRGYADAAAMSFDASTLTGVLPAGRLPAYTGSEISSAGGGLFTLQPTGVTAGSYAKIQVNAKGRVVAGDTLVAADIPTLTFSKVVNRPTSLAGYGITDVVSLAGGAMTGPLSLTQAPTAANQLANKAYVDSKVAGGGMTPFVTGDIIYKNSTSTPAGYLRCNGGEVSKATYAGLYSVIGDKFTKRGFYTNSSGKPWEQQYDVGVSTTSGLFANLQHTGNQWVHLFNDRSMWSIGIPVVTKNFIYLFGGRTLNSGSALFKIPVSNGEINTSSIYGCYVADLTYKFNDIYDVCLFKDYVYFIHNGYGLKGSIGFTTVSSTGELSTNIGSYDWVNLKTLPSVPSINNRDYAQLCIVGGRLHVFYSGQTPSSYATNEHYSFAIDTNTGMLSDQRTHVLPKCLAFKVMAIGDRAYMVGGASDGYYYSSQIYEGIVSSEGFITDWTTFATLPQANYGQVVFPDLITSKNFLYVIPIGGNSHLQIRIDENGRLVKDASFGQLTGITSGGGSGAKNIILKNNIVKLQVFGDDSYYIAAWNVNSSSFVLSNFGLDDYSNYTFVTRQSTPEDKFLLPDLSSDDKPGSYSYIKY